MSRKSAHIAVLLVQFSPRRCVSSFGDIWRGASQYAHNVIEVVGEYPGLRFCGQQQQALADARSLHASVTTPFTAHQQIGGRSDSLQQYFYRPTLGSVSEQQPRPNDVESPEA